ncbi:acyltransferase [Streptomyces scopuliridis]|uniref:acyltransferase family protein n=1 Tax=Streptomyces scopuliridis TaxID=452529 RepID=UPI002DD9A5C6|nr:acyltransferase [Streptomyces scopuliridis]WSB32670.1 acyltransferase [Streptomyces scopuliridis]
MPTADRQRQGGAEQHVSAAIHRAGRREAGRTGPRQPPSLTGLRFVAAALVFLHHAIYTNVFADPDVVRVFHDLFINTVQMGMAFFFVLSGFMLTIAARPGDTTRRFLRRRLVKIYPNHVVTFLLAAVLIIPALHWTEVAPNLLLVQTWWPRYENLFSGNPLSWSLACEVFFYLAFPLLLRGIRRIRPERLWWWAIGTMTAIVAVTLTRCSVWSGCRWCLAAETGPSRVPHMSSSPRPAPSRTRTRWPQPIRRRGTRWNSYSGGSARSRRPPSGCFS